MCAAWRGREIKVAKGAAGGHRVAGEGSKWGQMGAKKGKSNTVTGG